jgi:hypothetical protein
MEDVMRLCGKVFQCEARVERVFGRARSPCQRLCPPAQPGDRHPRTGFGQIGGVKKPRRGATPLAQQVVTELLQHRYRLRGREP